MSTDVPRDVRRVSPRGGAHPALERRRRSVRRAHRLDRGRIVVGGLGCLACAAVGWWLATGPALTVRDVSLSGYDRPDAPALDAALTDAAGHGGSLLSPPVGAIRRSAVTFPWVGDVVVHRAWPFGLRVEVIPARPAIVAVPARGEPVLVSPVGLVMGPADGVKGLARVRLPGAAPATGSPIPQRARAALTFALALDPAVSGRLRALTLERGRLTAKLTGGLELRLGQPTRMRAKAAALMAVLAGLSAEELKQATYVELSVPEHIAVGGLEPVDPAVAPDPSTSTTQ